MSTTTQPTGATGVSAMYVKLSDGTFQPIVDANGIALNSVINTYPQDFATTGSKDWYVTAPAAGVLSSVLFSSIDALAANDTNYLTFTITNLGQAGAGTTVMLAATAANTTKSTGGSALVANSKRTLTLSGTAANLVVAAGDRLKISGTATGTLSGTVTGSTFLVYFGGA